MPTRQSTTGVAGLVSETWFPLIPVEHGRQRAVSTLAVVSNGTSGATNQTGLATTSDGNGNDALLVNLTAAGGVVTAAAVGSNAGLGYRVGDYVTVTAAAAGTGADVVLRVTAVTG